MGVALFLVFVYLFGFVQLGTLAQLLGHVTFTISYVVIVVRGRLFAVGREYEEAAMDLGASQWQAMRMVLLPMLAPAIWASLMIAFAISIDDFVISAFLMGDASSATIPVKLYSAARLAPSPALNALASILLFASMLAITIAILVMRRSRKKEGTEGSAVEDFARLDLTGYRRHEAFRAQLLLERLGQPPFVLVWGPIRFLHRSLRRGSTLAGYVPESCTAMLTGRLSPPRNDWRRGDPALLLPFAAASVRSTRRASHGRYTDTGAPRSKARPTPSLASMHWIGVPASRVTTSWEMAPA